MVFFSFVVYDHQTVDKIEFKENNTNLCLKFGEALKENDLLLYILSDREPSSLELVVNQNLTLSHLCLLIKQELKINGKRMIDTFKSNESFFCFSDNDNDYHLCDVKSSLTNDGSPLNDFDQTLIANGLTNGAQVIMRPGSVASKNHVRLKVLRIIDKSYTPQEASNKLIVFH